MAHPFFQLLVHNHLSCSRWRKLIWLLQYYVIGILKFHMALGFPAIVMSLFLAQTNITFRQIDAIGCPVTVATLVLPQIVMTSLASRRMRTLHTYIVALPNTQRSPDMMPDGHYVHSPTWHDSFIIMWPQQNPYLHARFLAKQIMRHMYARARSIHCYAD